MRNLVSAFEVNCNLLPMAKSDLTLFGIPACVVYKDACSSGVGYTGETTHNVKIRWNEHESKID